MRSLTLLLFAASLLASSAAAADTTVRVTVRDIVDSPLAGAVATCTLGDVWSGSEETTEASEVLRLRNVPLSRDVDDERLRCTVVCAGYEAHTLRLTVTNNAATTVRLVPAYDDIEVAVRGEHDVDSVVKGAQLRCRTLDVGSGDWSPTATTDRSGVALVPGVRHGATLECKVSKAPRDYDAGVTSATFALIDDGSERTEPLRIVIALPVLVKLTVTLKDEQTGASLRDMRVEVLTRKGGDTLADRLSNRRGKVVTRVSADTRVVVRASDPHDRYVAVESELRTRVDPGRDSAKLVMRGLPPLPTTSLCELKIAQSTVRKAADGSALALARSYDNHAWEQVPNEDVDPATIELSCPTSTSEDCLLRVDDDWRIVELDVPAHLCSAPTPVHAAHVLEHAGLGASIAEITEFKRAYRRADPLPATSGAPGVANSPLDVEAFVVDQMDESKTPPTLLREYARARSNPRVRAGSPSGYVREACSIGSRWHAHAFNQYDIGATIIVRTGASVHTLSIDGVDRTQVTEFHNVSAPAAVPQSSVQICAVDEAVGGSMWVSINGCSSLYAEYPNPRVEFRSTPSNTWAPDAAKATFANVASYRTSAVVLSALTDTSVCPSERPRFLLHAGAYYLFDPRLASQHNTLDAPARAVAPETGVATQCVPLPKTFVNEASCEARQTCSGLQTASSTPVKLDTSTLAEFWSAGGRLVFTIDPDDLDVRESPYNDSPCSSSDGEATSRWRRTAIGNGCAAETTLRDDNAVATKATLKAAIEAALRQSPVNPHVVDIGFPLCDANSEQIGMSLTVSGPGGVLECATHVHPLAYAVLDFSVYAHSLDSDWDWDFDDGERNPIVAVAESGGTQLSLPRLVSMNDLRNRVHKNRVTVVGRLDDTVEFDELPASLRTPVLTTHFGATLRSARGDAPLVEVCGSPGEIENNGLLGARYPTQETRDWSDKMKELDWRMHSSHAKDNMWLNALLNRGRVADGKNEDVLRQRVAWALAQVFPVSVSTVSLDNWWEPWAAYYDIFVRHAFGSYRDILKEVSWSPIMARYLSFWRNRAFSDSGSFPDENYAREFLQLFSLGLWKLNDDGTYPVDAQGNRIDAYSNEDILDHARLWTGFDDQESRPNMEDDNGGKTTNYLDPMQLKPQWHDLMPKTNLDGGFLGDGYPRCVDLPSRHWLSKGATYELTGEQSLEGLQLDLAAERDPDGIGRRPRFEPNPSTSALYAALCAPNGSGRCTFPTSVTLTDNLDCDGEQECNAGSVLTVKIVCQVTARVRYFFYRHVPCVRMAFFAAADGQVAKNGGAMQCANRHTPSAYTSCCRVEVDGSTRHSRGNYDPEICMFLNERVTADVAAARCSAVTGATTETTDALGMCDEFSAGPYNSFERSCASSNLAWTTATCALKVQVYSENGRVTVIDDLDEGRYAVLARSRDSFFRVYWGELGYPLATQRETCADNCEYVPASDGAGTCVCDIEVVDTAVYAPSDTLPASLDDLARSLPVGAAKPDSFDGGRRAEKYSKCTSTVCATLESTRSIEVWVRNLSPDNTWPIDTIFVLPPRRAGGALRYRSNRASTVYVGGTPGDYSSATRFSFRNAPTFMPLAGEQNSQYTEWNNRKMLLPNVEADINALLDAVFEHDNVAPFVAYRLIQRLVTSNPSRRYMRSVVDAFRSGTYAGRTYSGKYGDMGAAVAAVVLDQEARSLTLQAEPRAGMLREPVLKLVHFMRALEFETLDTREVMMPELFAQLGQMAFHQPSVFGFFLPEFRPDGRVSAVGLAAPEFEIFTTPRIMSWLNGITSLVDYGLTSCENGFGYTSPEQGRRCWNEEGRLNTTDGWLQFAPTTRSLGYGPWVADELATVLTSGRASPETRKRIGAEYDAVIMLGGSTDEALRRVVKLYAMAQEFHTNAVRMPGVPRTPAPVNSAGRGREYRAVVVIFLAGGADSYSMLVPHTCASNLHDEYASVRGGAALNRATQMLEISSDASEQPCSKFGVHHRMPHLKSLYDAGEAAFLANVGAMVEPVTKEDYDGSSGVVKQWPPSLFSHNIMQRSMQNLHAQVASSKGVLGRCVQALLDNAKPYAAELVSIAGASKILEGTKAPDMVDARGGVEQFAQFESFRTSIDSLCDNVTASAMADTYAEGVLASIERTETIGPAVQSIELTEDFPTSTLGNQMAQVARMVRYHKQVGSERAAFLTLKGGWDTHGTFDLGDLYGDVDSSLNAFSDEMRDFGAWDNVAVMTVSDFGRTLTPNSEGTDHAWAGNYFLAGGAVNGGKIFGKYPSSLTESGEVSIGRGRLLPTHSFEAVWAGLAEWLGVESDQMDDVLPNLANFASDPELVWTESELFRSTKK